MLKNVLKILTILTFSVIAIASVSGKDYGTIDKMVVTAETIDKGSVTMSYSLDIVLNSDLKGEIDTFVIPMLGENFTCNYHIKTISSISQSGENIVIKSVSPYKASDKVNLAFKVVYKNLYKLNGKNEAIYKFKFDKIDGFYVKEAKLRWKIKDNIYANYTSKDDTYRYWNLKHLGMFSREVIVKYDGNLHSFPKENSKSGNIREYLIGGGLFFFLFLAFVLAGVIPNDSYRKNSGFGFNVKIKSL